MVRRTMNKKQLIENVEAYNILRDQLFKARVSNRLTALDIAEVAGCTSNTIYNIENGAQPPNVWIALRLARYFNLDLYTCMEGIELPVFNIEDLS